MAKTQDTADVLAALADPTAKVRALRKEIALAEAELTAMVKKGDSQGTRDVNARLVGLVSHQTKYEAIAKQQRDQDKRINRALNSAEIFKSVVGAQAIRQAVQGELDARGLVGLAIMSERTIAKAARELGGIKFGAMTARFLRAAPLIGEVVNAGIEIYARIQRSNATRERVEAMVKGGKLSRGEAGLVFDKIAENPLADPTELQNNVAHSADALLRMSQDQQRRALAGIMVLREDEHQAAVASYHGSSTQRSYVPLNGPEVIKRYATLMDQARNNGLVLSDALRREQLGDALASFIKDDKERDRVAALIAANIQEFQLKELGTTPTTIKEKFKMDEERRQTAVHEKRWIVPARLEY